MEASNFICQTNVEIKLSFVILRIVYTQFDDEKKHTYTHQHPTNKNPPSAFIFDFSKAMGQISYEKYLLLKSF